MFQSMSIEIVSLEIVNDGKIIIGKAHSNEDF
jgi:hypothetical protein